MTDYARIADGDPGGDIATAFAAMVDETVQATPVKKLSYIDIANEVGFEEASYLEAVVNAGIEAGQLPQWLKAALENNGVDINNSQTWPMLNGLVAGPFTQAMADAIKAAGVMTELKYPGIRLGHLETARAERAAGRL